MDMNEHYDSESDGDFSKGFAWAIMLSLPLWISFFGWIKILSNPSIYLHL